MTDDCSICLENMTDKQSVKLSCNHVFHLDCIQNIINNRCPLCRTKIISKSICNGNHQNRFFYASSYNKKGRCMICNGYSFKHLINLLVKD